MALTRITKGVIKPNEDFETRNVNSTGIVTATELDVNGNADISGSLSVGGVLTYEDVTSIDSVGIITARSGLVSPNADIDDFVSVGNNIHLGNAGVITATSFVGSGAALTGIDATAIKDSGGNVKVQAQASGAMYTGIHTFSSGAEVGSNIKLGNAGVITATSFVGSGAALTGIDATAIKDSGGNVKIQAQASGAIHTGVSTFQDLDVDGHTNLDNVSIAGVSTFSDNLKIIDDKKIIVGNGLPGVNDLEIFHQSSNNYNYIKSPARGFIIQNAGNSATYISANYFNLTNANISQTYATANNYGINLRYNNEQKLRTASSGIEVIGVTTTTGLAVTGVSTFTGNIDANGDLDVDGHTNLDNVSVAGVSTFSGILDATNTPASIRVAQDIQHKGDADTKITFPAADTVSVETGGSERVRIDSSGNVKLSSSALQTLAVKNFGYSGSYKSIMVGNPNSNVGVVALNVDVSGISGSNFHAKDQVVTGYRGFLTPNAAGNNFIGVFTRDASADKIYFGPSISSGLTNGPITATTTSVGIGINNPLKQLHVFKSNEHPVMFERGDTSNTIVELKTNGATRGYWGCSTTANFMVYDNDASDIQFQVLQNGNIETGNINSSGIVTATSVQQRTSKFYGVTTTERNALSPSEGDIIYNTTSNNHEFYTASNTWTPILSALPPTFATSAGNIGTLYNASLSNGDWSIAAIQASSNSGNITYTVTAGSLPTGMSMSTAGAFSGTVSGVGGDTTYTFTVSATNSAGTSTRQFNIVVKAEVTQNYSFTGSTVTWSRPTNVKYVAFRMWGGAGTHGRCTSNNHYPGRGGKTEGTINVSSHSSLYLQVGEAGKTYSNEPNAGWPNGGEGNNQHSCQGAGGGGSSNIYNSSGTGSYSNVIAVAGGGGSVSHGNPNSNGGDGGGTNGGSSNRGGTGGSQNAGGSQGSTPCGNTGNAGAGTQMQGGDAGAGSGCTNAGAGGGGGWYGGGAGGNSNGGNSYGGGGGGSGYYDTNLVSGGSTKQASESGWSTNKPSGIADRASYGDNNRGGHGYISLRY